MMHTTTAAGEWRKTTHLRTPIIFTIFIYNTIINFIVQYSFELFYILLSLLLLIVS
jgi:hypothetical protein